MRFDKAEKENTDAGGQKISANGDKNTRVQKHRRHVIGVKIA